MGLAAQPYGLTAHAFWADDLPKVGRCRKSIALSSHGKLHRRSAVGSLGCSRLSPARNRAKAKGQGRGRALSVVALAALRQKQNGESESSHFSPLFLPLPELSPVWPETEVSSAAAQGLP
eukprot:s1736_g3.t1